MADDVAAFMAAMSIPRAHVFGLSLGAAIGMWLAAKHPGPGHVAVAPQRLARGGRRS